MLCPSCSLRSRCGWFAPNINDWPRWNPTHFTGDDDPLEAVFARAAEEGTEEEAAAQREARTRELRRYREERNQASAIPAKLLTVPREGGKRVAAGGGVAHRVARGGGGIGSGPTCWPSPSTTCRPTRSARAGAGADARAAADPGPGAAACPRADGGPDAGAVTRLLRDCYMWLMDDRHMPVTWLFYGCCLAVTWLSHAAWLLRCRCFIGRRRASRRCARGSTSSAPA